MMTAFFRTTAMIGLLIGAAACTPVPQSEPCQSDAACAVAALIVADTQSDIGTDLGDGFIVRNVQQAGAIIVFDMEYPLPAAGLEDVQKRALHSLAAQGFTTGICSEPDAEEIFQFGNSYQIRSLGNDGVLIGASTVRSCGG